MVEPYARKTTRLREVLRLVGFAPGGEGGARLLWRIGMKASPSALLRYVRGSPEAAHPPPNAVGVDDFSGLLMNSPLILTMDRIAENERGLGSTLWNVSFDAGTGTGTFLFGFLVGYSGLAAAFCLSCALLLAALALDRPPHARALAAERAAEQRERSGQP